MALPASVRCRSARPRRGGDGRRQARGLAESVRTPKASIAAEAGNVCAVGEALPGGCSYPEHRLGAAAGTPSVRV